jgi:hypothetical protein
MEYWVLQASPKLYRVIDALANPGAIREWIVARYFNRIAVGDEFAFWVSGSQSGVYAFGVVTEPTELKVAEPDPYWMGPDDGSPEHLIGIEITDRLLPHYIPRSKIKADPALANSLIIRMPGGGNPFPLNDVQWQAIQSHRTRVMG